MFVACLNTHRSGALGCSELLFHLDIYSLEGDALAETAEGVVTCNRLDHHKLLEEMGAEAVAALVGVVVDEIVVRCLTQHSRTIGFTPTLCNVAR